MRNAQTAQSLRFTHHASHQGERLMDRDIWLILAGGLVGALSSLATIFAVYYLEGLRLRRMWEREDQLLMQKKREEIQTLLAAAGAASEDKEG
jgi:hypothetical protein